jgi:hypothetical protein
LDFRDDVAPAPDHRFVAPEQFALGRYAMDLKASVDGESPVEFLLLRTEEASRHCHGDYLRLIDLIRSPIGHNCRFSAGDHVLDPIGTFAVGNGNQKGVVVLSGYDWGFVGPTRTASGMADNRSAGFLSPGGSHGEWPGHLRQAAQCYLDWSVHFPRVPEFGLGGRVVLLGRLSPLGIAQKVGTRTPIPCTSTAGAQQVAHRTWFEMVKSSPPTPPLLSLSMDLL